MTITSIGTLGTNASTSTAATLAITTSGAFNASEYAAIIIAKNPEETTTTSLSVTDSAGNTWSRLLEDRIGAGARQTGIFVCRAASTLNSGGTITVTFASGSFTSASISAWSYTATQPLVLSATTDRNTGTATDLGTLNVDAGVNTSGSVLALRVSGTRATSGTFTPTLNWTAFTSATASTGTAATSMVVCGEFRIQNRALPGNSDPSWSVSGSYLSDLGAVYEAGANALFFGAPF